MSVIRTQYCHQHKTIESYPACDIGYSNSIRHCKNTQLTDGEKPSVYENPTTGEKRFLHTDYMAKHYESQGFQKREFNSYYEHKKWCDQNGYVNHAVEGIKDEALKG